MDNGTASPALLIVEDDMAMQQMCVQLFERQGFAAEGVSTAAAALERVTQPGERTPIAMVLTDVRLGRERPESGIELLRQIKAARPELPVIVMTGYATVQDAVEAMKLGAADYVTKPFERAELINKVQAQFKVRALESEVKVLREALDERYGIHGLIGACDAMRAVCDRIEAAGRSNATVLITGESGTGKELVARAIHLKSARRDKPFVPVNCAALPENLIESELFGHEAGAFTGAARENVGLFRAAHGGTIFLDEIADMPSGVQAKLLRVLQDHRVRPVGSTRETPVDVRVVAATNSKLGQPQDERALRADLFFRLSVIRIEIPPLRERPGDLPLLIQHFLAKHAKNAERRIRRVAPEALDVMLSYTWPGNIRELESVIESAYALGSDEFLTRADLPPQVVERRVLEPATSNVESVVAARPAEREIASAPLPASFKLEALEKDALVRALQAVQGNKSRAAELLGVSRKRLYRMLSDYGMAGKEET